MPAGIAWCDFSTFRSLSPFCKFRENDTTGAGFRFDAPAAMPHRGVSETARPVRCVWSPQRQGGAGGRTVGDPDDLSARMERAINRRQQRTKLQDCLLPTVASTGADAATLPRVTDSSIDRVLVELAAPLRIRQTRRLVALRSLITHPVLCSNTPKTAPQTNGPASRVAIVLQIRP